MLCKRRAASQISACKVSGTVCFICLFGLSSLTKFASGLIWLAQVPLDNLSQRQYPLVPLNLEGPTDVHSEGVSLATT